MFSPDFFLGRHLNYAEDIVRRQDSNVAEPMEGSDGNSILEDVKLCGFKVKDVFSVYG